MENWQQRQEMLVGPAGLQALAAARVVVVGLGGVGAAAAEGLVRAGVGNLLLVDNDTLTQSNINRQLIATVDTLGQKKTEACKARMLAINPAAQVKCSETFVLPGHSGGVFAFAPHYIIDAVDTVAAKLYLIETAGAAGIPLISCMGTGGRMSADGFAVGDIADTAGCGCPVARVLRRELRRRGVEKAQVLYNQAPPILGAPVQTQGARHAPGSISYVPPIAGFLAAGHVVRQLLQAAGIVF